MPRSVPEWIGATPDTKPPPRVRARVWERFKGRCHSCGRKIMVWEEWTLEHLKALINGGENRESNLGITCEFCLPGKNADDLAEKAMVARKRNKHLGLDKPKSRPMPGTIASGVRRGMDGNTYDRKTGELIGGRNR